MAYVTVRDSAHPWWALSGRVLARTGDTVTLVPPLRLDQANRAPLTIHLTPTHTIEENK